MTSKDNYSSSKPSVVREKKNWIKPAIIPIEQEKIRQEDVELYYRMMDNPDFFQRLTSSTDPQN